MKVAVAATKSNLLKMKRSLELTREGHGLLDEKRKILLEEMTALVDSVDRHQRQVEELLRLAYAQMQQARIGMGSSRLRDVSLAVNIRYEISISHRRIMGVYIPVISLDVKENAPFFRSLETSLSVDESMAKFKEVVAALAKLAEKKIALLRIAAEVSKTIRKVNALEKVYIPRYTGTVKYIAERLDEESRDSFALLKMIKKRRTAPSSVS